MTCIRVSSGKYPVNTEQTNLGELSKKCIVLFSVFYFHCIRINSKYPAVQRIVSISVFCII